MKSKSFKYKIVSAVVAASVLGGINIGCKYDLKEKHSYELKGKIVYSNLSDIYSYDIESNKLMKILSTEHTGRHASYPIWADKDHILFTMQEMLSAPYHIAVIDSKGNEYK
ncbi:MAG TPA: hypothetical protein VF941_19350, partial [Clostridia bacterium]